MSVCYPTLVTRHGHCVSAWWPYYRPLTKLQSCNVFTGVCHSIQRGVGPMWLLPMMYWDVGTSPTWHRTYPLPCQWHLVVNTGDLFKLVHLRTHTSTSPQIMLPSSSGHWNTYSWQTSSTHPTGMLSCYYPLTKLREGNVFTPVCHSVHMGVVCIPECTWAEGMWWKRGVYPSMHLDRGCGEGGVAKGGCEVRGDGKGGRTTPWTQLVMAIKAGGTHPTGMHSCLCVLLPVVSTTLQSLWFYHAQLNGMFTLLDTDTKTDTDKMSLQPNCIYVGVCDCVGQYEDFHTILSVSVSDSVNTP